MLLAVLGITELLERLLPEELLVGLAVEALELLDLLGELLTGLLVLFGRVPVLVVGLFGMVLLVGLLGAALVGVLLRCGALPPLLLL